MRTILLAYLIGIAAASCGKPDPNAERKFDERLSKSIAQAMCSEHPPSRVSALSEVAEAAQEAQAEGEGIEQRVYDEASDLADEGCPAWARAADESVLLAQKVVAEQIAKNGGTAQNVTTKNASTPATSKTQAAAE